MNTKKYGIRVFAVGEELSNDTRITGLNNNDLIIGNSGSGKTGAYVVNALQNIDGSLVVSDTKGLLHRYFASSLRAKGYKVEVLDFVNPANSTCGYNPLAYIKRYDDGSYREKDILTIANSLCIKQDKREPIWDNAAKAYVSFLIAYCLEREPAPSQNMMTVARLRREFSKPNGDIPFSEWAEKHPDSLASKKFFELTANKRADKMWASIEGFVNVYLDAFNYREMSHVFERGDCFDVNDLGRQKTVLFIIQSDTDRAYDNLITLFYAQALQALCAQADANSDGRLKIPTRLIMDDMGASAPIMDFDKVISVIRSRDISVSMLVQSLSQLESQYEHNTALTITNNCDNILFLASNDRETCEYIAYRAGVLPDDVFSMPRNKAYLLRSGEKARLVNKIMPYSTFTPEKYVQEEPEEVCTAGIAM